MRESGERSYKVCRIVGAIPEVGRRKRGREGRAVEEVVRTGVEGETFRTDWIVGTADEDFKISKIGAEAGAEAPQRYSGFARKDLFRRMNERRTAVEDPVWAGGVDVVADNFRMDLLLHLLKRTRRHDSVL